MGKTNRRQRKEMTEAQLERALERDEQNRRKRVKIPAPIQKDHYHDKDTGGRHMIDRAAIEESLTEEREADYE